MRKVEPVVIRAQSGEMEVDTYVRWMKKVGNEEYEFALTADPRKPGRLAITEVSTGFDTGAQLRHPRGGLITEASFKKGSSGYVPYQVLKNRAKTALHGLLVQVSPLSFKLAVAQARIKVRLMQVVDEPLLKDTRKKFTFTLEESKEMLMHLQQAGDMQDDRVGARIEQLKEHIAQLEAEGERDVD